MIERLRGPAEARALVTLAARSRGSAPGVDLSAQSGSFSRRSVRHTMLAGSGLSALPRTASYAFSCMLNAADFLKKRNGFCTSQTRSEAEAALSVKGGQRNERKRSGRREPTHEISPAPSTRRG